MNVRPPSEVTMTTRLNPGVSERESNPTTLQLIRRSLRVARSSSSIPLWNFSSSTTACECMSLDRGRTEKSPSNQRAATLYQLCHFADSSEYVHYGRIAQVVVYSLSAGQSRPGLGACFWIVGGKPNWILKKRSEQKSPDDKSSIAFTLARTNYSGGC